MTIVYNQDIVGQYDRLNRALFETLHSASSGGMGYSEADITRQRQYTGDLLSKHEHIISEPALDLVETHPNAYELRAPTVIQHLENDGSNDLIRLYEATRDELINSQSARLATNLVSFDAARFEDNVHKIQHEIDYIEDVQPIDLPESIPKVPLKGLGRKGV